nr:MAG: hemolysin [Bacteriophage sp.]
MDSTPITRAEHEEFCKRVEAEDNRQNKRLEILEEQIRQFTDLVLSVQELAQSVKQLAETQKVQGEKLDELEGRDGEMWRRVLGYVITSITGLVVGFLFHKLGM